MFFFLGKTFLNTIEYLDLKTNEWTTFIPKGTCDLLLKKKPRTRRNSRKSISEDKKSIVSSNVSIKEQSSESLKSKDSIENKNGVEVDITVKTGSVMATPVTDKISEPENGTLERETVAEL